MKPGGGGILHSVRCHPLRPLRGHLPHKGGGFSAPNYCGQPIKIVRFHTFNGNGGKLCPNTLTNAVGNGMIGRIKKEGYFMTYQELLETARTCSGPYCKACPVCNGRACKNTMPGPGSKGTGTVAARNYDA